MASAWKKHVVFTEGAHVQEICSPLKQLSIDGFFFTRIFPDGKFIDLATDLQWTEHFLESYFAEKYNFTTVKAHMAIENNIDLWSIDENNECFIDAHTNFDVKDGISIKFTQKKWQDVFSYYITNKNELNAHCLINLIDILRKFSEYFLESAADIIAIGQKSPLILPPKYSSPFAKSTEKVNLPFNEMIQQITGGALNLPGFRSLTAREKACIQHAKKGLSSDAIGKKMFLSKRTVESYMVSARNKTNCKNLTELVYHYDFIKNFL